MISRPGQKAPNEPSDEKVNASRFERRVTLSRLALILEKMWEALLWPFLVVSLFLIVSLFELWGALPPLAHRVLLFGFVVALLASFIPLIRMTWPTRQEALRRLERDAGIKHRPATSYEDRIGDTASGEATLLWHAHRDRLARLVARLKPRWPDPRTDRSDPFALRAVLLLLLFVGFLSAGGSSLDRIRQAFTLAPRSAVALMRLDAWVAPPVYTQRPPIVLADGTEPVGTGAESFRALQVPERSDLIVRAHAPQGESVSLITDKEDGGSPVTVEPKKSGSQGLVEFNVKLSENGSADVRVGGSTIAKWRFAMIKDETPTINLMGNPTVTPRGALRLVFHAEDDNGVAGADAKFALAEGQLAASQTEIALPSEKDPLLEPPSMRLQLPRANQKIVDGKATQDLTSHPWAGLKVNMVLSASDQAGQSGSSQTYEFVLPERNFTKALAKALVEQRKKLVREPDSSVARALDALTLGGEKSVDSTSVYLAIRNAFWRLQNDQSREGIASVVGQLWDIALKIEDGDLPDAERAVKEAQEKLSEALAKDATPEEIGRLVNELREALGQYLKTLAERQERDQQQGEPNQASDQQEISPQDLDKMLKNIEQLAKSGSKDLAQDMLAELKDVIDQLETGQNQSSAKDKRAERMMNDLKEMLSKQQKLLDDTYKAKRDQAANQPDQQGEEFEVSPPGQPMEWGNNMNMERLFEMPEEGDNAQQDPNARGNQSDDGRRGDQGEGKKGRVGQGSSRYGSLGSRQGEIEQQLQSLIDRMRMEGAEAPEQFGAAGKSMNEAKDALGEENLDRAAQAESQALERLREGAQSMAQQMSENGENQEGRGQGNSGRDPLGRPDRTNRPDLGLSVKVPDAIDIQRAREVLDEVRRRLGDPSRPPIELDYLERLIRAY